MIKHGTCLAVLPIVAHGTGASVGAQAVGAGAAVLTRLGVAFVLLILAECAVEAGTAATRKGVDVIDACAVIQAGTAGGNRKK